jgi:hypothetical protein
MAMGMGAMVVVMRMRLTVRVGMGRGHRKMLYYNILRVHQSGPVMAPTKSGSLRLPLC